MFIKPTDKYYVIGFSKRESIGYLFLNGVRRCVLFDNPNPKVRDHYQIGVTGVSSFLGCIENSSKPYSFVMIHDKWVRYDDHPVQINWSNLKGKVLFDVGYYQVNGVFASFLPLDESKINTLLYLDNIVLCFEQSTCKIEHVVYLHEFTYVDNITGYKGVIGKEITDVFCKEKKDNFIINIKAENTLTIVWKVEEKHVGFNIVLLMENKYI